MDTSSELIRDWIYMSKKLGMTNTDVLNNLIIMLAKRQRDRYKTPPPRAPIAKTEPETPETPAEPAEKTECKPAAKSKEKSGSFFSIFKNS